MFGWFTGRTAALGGSILLHLLILFFGYYLQQDNPLSNIIPITKKLSQKKEFEWAATEAAPSQFGAPVKFQSIPEPVSTQNVLDKEIEEEIYEEDNQEDTAQETSLNIEKSNTISDLETIIDTLPETIKTNKKKRKKTKIAKKQKKKYTKVEKTTPQSILEQASVSAKTSPDRLPNKNPLTLSQLANGFLDHVKTNGTDSITTLGKKGLLPTDEQLKHQRYAEKIAWCLQQSFKQNYKRLTDYHQCVVEVFLALNKNGSINQLSIAKSSGKPRVDQFVLFTFQDAQSSFPPVPHYFTQDPYRIIYTIQVDSMLR